MCIHGYSGYKDSGIRADTGLDTNFCQNGYRIGYKFLLKWIQDTGLDTNFCSNGYRIPDWIHKIFQNLESNSKINFSDYRSIII